MFFHRQLSVWKSFFHWSNRSKINLTPLRLLHASRVPSRSANKSLLNSVSSLWNAGWCDFNVFVCCSISFIQVEFLRQTGRVSVRLELFCLLCRHLKYKHDHVTSDSKVRHFTVRQRSCGKVMFQSCVYVSLFSGVWRSHVTLLMMHWTSASPSPGSARPHPWTWGLTIHDTLHYTNWVFPILNLKLDQLD